jgi:hypothetical protein
MWAFELLKRQAWPKQANGRIRRPALTLSGKLSPVEVAARPVRIKARDPEYPSRVGLVRQRLRVELLAAWRSSSAAQRIPTSAPTAHHLSTMTS